MDATTNLVRLASNRYQVVNEEGVICGSVDKQVFKTYTEGGEQRQAHFWIANARGMRKHRARRSTRKAAVKFVIDNAFSKKASV